MDSSNNQLQMLEDREPAVIQKGDLSEAGLMCEDGTFIERYKRENRPGLSDEDEDKIASQVKAFKVMHPHMEIGVIDMIRMWNHRDPEGCEKYVKEQRDKKKNITKEELFEEMNRNKFPEMHEYERVY